MFFSLLWVKFNSEYAQFIKTFFMIVHLFDDQKFVDITIKKFDNLNSEVNRYIVLSNTQKLKHVSNTKRITILSNSSYSIDCNLIFNKCNLLVIHFLTPLKSFIIKQAPSNVKILWSAWGADFYSQLKDYKIYEEITENLISNNKYFQFRKSNIYNLYHFLRYRVFPIKLEKKVLNKIDYLATVLPYEFDLITNKLNFSSKYIDFNYGINYYNDTIEFNLGNKVLIGNSATYSNNHLDLFDKIKDSNCHFICPLNYGGYDFKKYQNRVISAGVNYFNSKISFIKEFLPNKEYDKILIDCNTAIMFHIRQQALANIFKLLFIGVRLYLNKNSSLFEYFKENGAIVFTIEKNINLLGVELSIKEKSKNKLFVKKFNGKVSIDNKYQNIIALGKF